jgi:hypothetical protein
MERSVVLFLDWRAGKLALITTGDRANAYTGRFAGVFSTFQ